MFRLPGLLFASALFLSAPLAFAQEKLDLDTPEKRLSYAIGQNIASQIQNDFRDGGFDADVFIRAIDDSLRGEGGQMSPEELSAAFDEYRAAEQAAAEAAAKEKAAEGVAFLAEHAKNEGIQSTESGLLYQVTTEGDGAKPTLSDTVTVHYTGRLLDGTVFDSSVARGQPATFPVSGVIAGWTEALQLMNVGSTWEVWIPQELAYGERGAGNDIPPYAVLNFTIELIGIE